jgi:hypothetical protein
METEEDEEEEVESIWSSLPACRKVSGGEK